MVTQPQKRRSPFFVIAGPFLLFSIPFLMAGCTVFPKPPSSPRAASYLIQVVDDRPLTEKKPEILEIPNSWSPDGNYLAATIMHRTEVHLEVIDVRTGKSRSPIPPSEFHDYFPAWSPDGKQLVFFSDRSGNFDIWTVNADGTDLRQLTTNAADDVYPAWSPDGAKIGFLSVRSKEIAIWMMNRDGTDQRQVTAGGNGDWGVAWSPDGKRIAFGSTRLSALNQPKPGVDDSVPPSIFREMLTNGRPSQALWIVDLETLTLRRIAGGDYTTEYFHPAWSPDGAKIAFVSNQSGTSNIWVMNSDGINPQQLTSGRIFSGFPTWHPNGKQMAYQTVHNIDGSAHIRLLTYKKVERQP